MSRSICIACGCMIDGEAAERGDALHEACVADGRAAAWAALRCLLYEGRVIDLPKSGDLLADLNFLKPLLAEGGLVPSAEPTPDFPLPGELLIPKSVWAQLSPGEYFHDGKPIDLGRFNCSGRYIFPTPGKAKP